MSKLKFFPHCTEYPPQYWSYPPTVLMLSPHCTEQPPQYWRYPPQYWSYPPHVLLLSPHSTEGIPPQYWIPSTVLMLSLHSTDVIPPQYWCYPPTVLMLSPHVLMLSPHVLMLSPHCTEQPPQYWSYPPTILKLSPHNTEAIPPQYWSYPPLYWTTSTVLKLSPHSTDVIPPMYWTTSNVLNNLHSTEPTLCGVVKPYQNREKKERNFPDFFIWERSSSVCTKLEPVRSESNELLEINLLQKFSPHAFQCFIINTYSMKSYCIIYFEHRNDVTSIVKLCLEIRAEGEYSLWSLTMLVTSFLCSK